MTLAGKEKVYFYTATKDSPIYTQVIGQKKHLLARGRNS